jgi:phage repressor protein C with HTH and peptisase S24 domain
MLSDSPGKRLALFRTFEGLSQRALGQALGVSGGLVGQLEADISAPSRAFLQKMSNRYNISADWLLNGHGDMFSAPTPTPTASGFREGRVQPPDYTSPAHGDFAAVDGHEAGSRRYAEVGPFDQAVFLAIGGERERLAFSRTWLRRNRITAQLAVLVRVKGDSMAPGIPDGALVLVHCAENAVDREGVYAFLRGDDAFVKRLVPAGKQPDGRPAAIIIVSDNRAYPTESISTATDRDGMRVIGRVRCVMSTLE